MDHFVFCMHVTMFQKNCMIIKKIIKLTLVGKGRSKGENKICVITVEMNFFM